MTSRVNIGRLLFLVGTLVGLGSITIPAHADPPRHAPAYGNRDRFDRQDDRRINRLNRYEGNTYGSGNDKRSRIDRDSDWNRRIAESDRLREQNRQRLLRERFRREMEQRERRNDRYSDNNWRDHRPGDNRNDRFRPHP